MIINILLLIYVAKSHVKFLNMKLPCQSELGNNVDNMCQERNSHYFIFFSTNIWLQQKNVKVKVLLFK